MDRQLVFAEDMGDWIAIMQTTLQNFQVQYATESEGLVDYDLWRPQGLDFSIRGPKVFLSSGVPVISYIGAAQTFGIFVKHPFPSLVGELTGTQTLNLAKGGAGAVFYLKRPPVLDLVNSTSACVIQVMSPRSSMVNSHMHHVEGMTTVRITQGSHDGKTLLGHHAFKMIAADIPRSGYRNIIRQTLDNYVLQYSELLDTIHVPKILLYISTASPFDSEEEIDPSCIGSLGSHPHMVTREVLRTLSSKVDCAIEVVSKRLKNARLVSSSSGTYHVIKRDSLTISDHSAYAAPPYLHNIAALKISEALESLLQGSIS